MTKTRINRTIFYNAIRPHFGGSINNQQFEGMQNLLDVWEKYFTAADDSMADLAYNLATAKHETAHTMQPIKERGRKSYFLKYERGRLAKVLGNTRKGDGYRYRGEGHVQNTGRRNARVSGPLLHKYGIYVDFEKHPEKRGDPFYSALLLFEGNKQGLWTGRDLADYIDDVREGDDEDLREFIRARAVVNGKDKALKIGRSAMRFYKALLLANKTVEEPRRPPKRKDDDEVVQPKKRFFWK